MSLTLTVTRLGHRGDGVAEGPEGPVHVRRALPGEVVEGEVVDGRMAAPRILVPSRERVAPPCPHARTCGGCAVQHLRDEAVATWKLDLVRRALAARGLAASLRPIVSSPAASRRRATLAGRRTRSGVQLGFHTAGAETIVDTPECRLVHPDLHAIRPALAELVRLGTARQGTLALTVTRMREGADVAVTGGKPLDPELRTALAAAADRLGLVRLTWDGEPVAQRLRPTLTFDGIAVSPPPGAFLQATEEGEAALREAVAEAVGDAGRVVDLFAGCGTFALPLARRAEVHAVEADAEMVRAAEAGWRGAAGLKRLTAETRDLFRRPLLAAELAGFDAAVIDPPRAGAVAQTAELAISGVERIGFVSCNPATFARDAATLVASGYRLDRVQVVDQFRWSAHVELAALFLRTHAAVIAP